MKPSVLFRISGAIALCIAATIGGNACAEAGRVEFVVGSVFLTNPQGMRPLVRGTTLESGDTVRTVEGRAQIRFSDGAYVSLQPNTEFAIKDYRFDGKTDGTERGVFELAKGTVRTVTGLIGRVTRNAYELLTPTATIGIRGTGGIISVSLDGTTRIIGTTGIWTLLNASGSIEIPAGRVGIATPDQTKPPEQTGEAPQAPPAPVVSVVQVPIAKAEERTSTGGTVALLDTSKPIGIVYAEVIVGGQFIELNTLQDSSITVGDNSLAVKGNVGPSGELSGLSFLQAYMGSSFGYDYKFSGTLMEGGTDGAVSWGRWTGPVTVTFTQNGVAQTSGFNAYPANGGFHYALGNPTVQMPASGSFTYNMIGATAPTVMDASIAPGTVTSGQLIGTFTPTGGSVSMNLGFSINSQTFTMSATGTIPASDSAFTGSGTVSGGACSANCMSSIAGGFAGSGASHAGVAYRADIMPYGTQQVGGVVVLRR